MVLLITSLFLLVAMALVLLTKRTTHYKSNFFLAFVYVAMAYMVFYSLMFQEGAITSFSAIRHSHMITLYIIGPCLRFYVFFATGREFGFRFKSALHLLSLLPGIVYIMGCYAMGTKESFLSTCFSESLALILGLAVFLCYFVCTCRLVVSYGVNFGMKDRIRLTWLKTLLPAVAIVTIILVVINCGVVLPPTNRISIHAFLCFLVIGLFLWQSHHAELFFEKELKQFVYNKYTNSCISEKQLDDYAQRLLYLLETDKCYLNPSLTRDELACKVGIAPHQLSQVLNKRLGLKFNDFINQYRVKRAVELLYQPENNCYTIESIAMECGFSNRVTFFSAFKKHTGKAPAACRRAGA